MKTQQGSSLKWWLLGACLVLPAMIALAVPHVPAMRSLGVPYSSGTTFPASRLRFTRAAVGPEARIAGKYGPQIANVQILDLDDDGRRDILACDAKANAVYWYRQTTAGTWEEKKLAGDLAVPAHATVLDIDLDGDKDIVVSILGDIFPNDEKIGSVVLLENVNGEYRKRTLLDGVRRVADVQGADFDADGDIDLAVAAFGYDHGSVLWLENDGQGKFQEHELISAPGAIHVPLGDFDGDGDIDITTVISQNEEEVWGFENLGDGKFRARRLYFTYNFDLGSAGLVKGDLDGDGDLDLVLPAGDNFENDYTAPQPYHGCYFLENNGNWDFTCRQIAQFGGTYAADVGDMDGDGDLDVALVSMFNQWNDPRHASLVWLENDGAAQFKPWQIDNTPTHIVTVACGDLNGDGREDIASGGLHVIAPYDRMGRVMSWLSTSGQNDEPHDNETQSDKTQREEAKSP